MMHHADIALEMANVGQDRKFTLRLPILLKTQAQALQRLCERRLQSHGVNAEQVLPPAWSIGKNHSARCSHPRLPQNEAVSGSNLPQECCGGIASVLANLLKDLFQDVECL